MQQSFSIIPVSSEFHNRNRMEQLEHRFLQQLAPYGGIRAAAPPDPASPPVFLVLSGGTERQILQIFNNCRKRIPDTPLLLLAHPGNNSLPASLELLARIRQEGGHGRIFYLPDITTSAPVDALLDSLHGFRVKQLLHGSRVGMVGEPSDWLIASSQNPADISDRWGITVKQIPLKELEKQLRSQPPDSADPLIDDLLQQAETIDGLDREELSGAVHIYRQLGSLASRYNLNALSLRCFDLVTAHRKTGCFALAQLNDDGIIAGCEGDLPSALGMLWGRLMTGTLPWMANPSRIDPANNTLVLAHCTVPRSLTRGYRLLSHFESDTGVAIAGQFNSGPVTLLRLGGSTLQELWTAQGELTGNGEAPDLCRTQIHISLQQGNVLDLLERPLGNHTLVLSGHHAERLSAWFNTYIAGER